MDKKIFSLICAVGCSFLWGTAFVAQDMGMDYIGPWTFSAARLILGFLALLPFFFIFEYKKIKETKLNYKFVVGYIFFLGFLLAGGNILQQISLIYTDVANSAVFTVLYVVIVPIIAFFLFSKKIHISVWPSVMMCLIGGFLLSELGNLRVRFGDTLVVIGAFFWAFHIVYISKFLKVFNFPITIASFQCLTAAIFSSVPMFAYEYVSLKVLSLEAAEATKEAAMASELEFSGVSLDTEAAQLLEQQQAFQASARILATARQLFQTLLDVV